MKCDKCGKEFQTYRGICPYCHNKNEKDTQEQPSIKYSPIVKPDPPASDRPRISTANIRSQSPVKIREKPDNTLKYALMGGLVLLVVLSVAVMAQSLIGASLPSASTSEVYVTTQETIPSLYTPAATNAPITYARTVGTLNPNSMSQNSKTSTPHATTGDSRNTQSFGGNGQVYSSYSPSLNDEFYSIDGMNGPIVSAWTGGTHDYEIMFHPRPGSKYFGKFDYLIIQIYGFENEGYAEKTYQELYKCDQTLTLAGRQVTYEFDRARGQTNICWRVKDAVMLVGTGPFKRDAPNEEVQRDANIYAATLVIKGADS